MHSIGRIGILFVLVPVSIGLTIAAPAFCQFSTNSSSHSSSSRGMLYSGGGSFNNFGSTANGGLPMSGFGGSTLGSPFTGLGGTTFGGGTGFGSGTTFGGTAPGVYGNTGVGPAPGVSSFTGMGMTPSQYYYYRNRGYGLSPMAVGGGFYQLGAANPGLTYWLSPSGYYYPWGGGVYGSYPSQVVYVFQQGSLSEGKPSVSVVISDIRRFLLDAKSQQQLDLTNFESFSARLNDISTRVTTLASNNGGMLDASDDVAIRRDLDYLITDITQALHN